MPTLLPKVLVASSLVDLEVECSEERTPSRKVSNRVWWCRINNRTSSRSKWTRWWMWWTIVNLHTCSSRIKWLVGWTKTCQYSQQIQMDRTRTVCLAGMVIRSVMLGRSTSLQWDNQLVSKLLQVSHLSHLSRRRTCWWICSTCPLWTHHSCKTKLELTFHHYVHFQLKIQLNFVRIQRSRRSWRLKYRSKNISRQQRCITGKATLLRWT